MLLRYRVFMFHLHPLEIPGVVMIEPPVYKDGRGFFMETYRASDFASLGISMQFVQDCHSKSSYSVLRGLHFQKNKPQGKLVRVLQGEIFDVVVDIRSGSPTYGKWVGTKLSGKNKRTLYVPIGFAHGFCVLSKNAEILYKLTEEYSPQDEKGICWNDPDIGICWPISNPILSQKDKAFPLLKNIDTGVQYRPN